MKTPLRTQSGSPMTPDEVWGLYLREGRAGLARRMPFLLSKAMAVEPQLFRILPSDPRCVTCMVPFQGAVAKLMRLLGRGRSNLNPSICRQCEDFATAHEAAAEVDITMVFADIRGSTRLAESMDATSFGRLINRFFQVTVDALVAERGLIEKLVGDEVAAFFVPGISGADYTRRAIRAAQEILRLTGHSGTDAPWAPVGIGVHSGPTLVGVVGNAQGVNQISVLGDAANTTSRLASEAQTGEIIISEAAVLSSGMDTQGLMPRELQLKGKQVLFKAWSLQLEPEGAVR